jgi:PAS domain S-box-containing protein
LHKLLARQLNRLDLKNDELPENIESWRKLIEVINNAYTEADQERYMLERSMEISSRELMELNEKLENAQHIARLGYWLYNEETRNFSFSKELCKMLGLSISTHALNYKEFMDLFTADHRASFQEGLKKMGSLKGEYEGEVCIKNTQTTDYNWYYIRAYVEQHNLGNAPKVYHGIAIDITKRKQIEEEVALLNQKLIESARLTGMADVAISVLHNVGNILNSANVSLGVLHEHLDHSNLHKFFKLVDMMRGHISSLNNYLTQDSKGKLIPEYVLALEPVLKNELNTFQQEVSNLSKHINHIKDIVSMQQAVSKVSGIKEKVFVPEVIDTALQINGGTSLAENITITKEYEESGFISVDKAKLSQILINLIQNAKDAVRMNSTNSSKKIAVSVKKDPEGKKLNISVADNGIGISPDNMVKIFSFGYTTKKNVHGFGLHGSALAAKEIGGSLKVESKGLGEGAVFTVAVPIDNDK